MIYEEKKILENGLPVQFICHIQYNKKGGFISPHYHDYIEIIYSVHGTNEIRLNDACYTFSTGDLVLINSRDVHSIACGDGCYIVLRFEPDLLYRTPQCAVDLKYILPFVLNGENHANIFTKDILKNCDIPQKMYEIYEEYSKKKYGYELAVINNINSIFLWFLRYWHNNNIDINLNTAAHEGAAIKLQKVLKYVEENYNTDITAENMAHLCNMSYSYFSRIFKKIMKKSFSEYLTYIRVNEAEKLLATSDMNITEIAMDVGFSSSSYFIQQFKKERVISPKQYRKNFEASK